MTKKEAIDFLTNTKVYVRDKGEEIQAKLFTLGFEWERSQNLIKYPNMPFIYIDKKCLTYGTNVKSFYSNEYREITPEDILNINIESKYRPFKDAKECWQEMLKHQPFGWIKDKVRDYYIFLNDISENTSFYFTFNHYVFADGTPFGIKEE